MLKDTKERLILTKHPIIHNKQTSIPPGTITAQSHTMMLKSNFSNSIMAINHLGAVKKTTLTKVVKDTKSLGTSGRKMQLKRHTLEKEGTSKTSLSLKVALNFLGLIIPSRANKSRRKARNLINRRTQITGGRHQELLFLHASFKCLRDLPHSEESFSWDSFLL